MRDIIFYKRRHFNELLHQSEEKIASNILRDRLAMFVKEGLLTKGKGPNEKHMQKVTYSLTEKSIELLPLLVSAIEWSIKYEPVDMEKYKPAVELCKAGQAGIEGFQNLLKKEHLTVA